MRFDKNSLLALAILAILATPLAHAGSESLGEQRMRAAEREAHNWLSHGRTYSEQRYSPLTQIDQSSVSRLGLAWTYKLDVDRGIEATPIVVDGVMYTTGAFSMVYALDAASGKLLWKYDPQVPRHMAGRGCCDVVNRGVAVWEGRVYVGAFDGRLIALSAKTGKPLWSVDTRIDPERSYTITGAPRVVKGKVIVGNGGAEFGVRGYVSAYDARTGRLDWRFFTVPGDPAQPPENAAMAMARQTWFGDQYHQQGGGGTVWDSMAYDPELNQLYIGVGNGSYWNIATRSAGRGDNLFLSSIVALNPDNGEYLWHYQTTPGDKWDFTATQTITLADLDIAGKPAKVLMQAPKNGFFYVLDRTNGQLLSAEKFAPANWATHVDKATGRPAMTDDADYVNSDGFKLVVPGFLGAHSWHPMSFSPKTGLVYIPAQETAAAYRANPETARSGNPAIVNLGVIPAALPEDTKAAKPILDSYKGKLLAWNPVEQKAAWSVAYPGVFNGGTLATAGNLVFQGTADGRVTAYAADSGKLLWESPANTGVMAGPVTYAVKGQQYVTFMAGWGGVFPLVMGPFARNGTKVRPEARVLTYKLGGQARLPPPKGEAQPLPRPPALMFDDEASIQKGRDLFNAANCSGCHGINAISGGIVPDLRYLTSGTHQQFNLIVKGLRSPKGMPSFHDILDDEQIGLIHNYVIKRAHDLQWELAEK